MTTLREHDTGDDAFDALLREVARAPAVRLLDLDLAGRTIGRYDVRDRIGAGGMGVVYEAWDTRLRRAVALKVLRAWRGDGHAERLVAEARRAAALSHPNIAAVFDVDTIDDVTFMALELVEGRSLKAVLSSGGVDPETALRIARRIASALARAHLAGIVHRDITPSNVMIGAGGAIKVLDFGIATADMTSSGGATGTPGYQSPEQAAGDPVDARTDVYAFGVLLREMVESRPTARNGLARSLVRIAARCAARRLADRPRDGAAVAALLRSMPRAHGTAEGLVVFAAAGVAAAGLFAAATQGWVSPRGAVRSQREVVPHEDVITSVRVERAAPVRGEEHPLPPAPRVSRDEVEPESHVEEAPQAASPTPPVEDAFTRFVSEPAMTMLPITAGVDLDGRLIAIADLRVLDPQRDRGVGRVHVATPAAGAAAGAAPAVSVPQQLEGKVIVSTGEDGLMRVVIDLRPPPASSGGGLQLGAGEDSPGGNDPGTKLVGPSKVRSPTSSVSRLGVEPQTAGTTGSRAVTFGTRLTAELCQVPALDTLMVVLDDDGNVRVIAQADEEGAEPHLFAIIDGNGVRESHHGVVACLAELGG